MLLLPASGPCLHGRLSSNVRPRSAQSSFHHSSATKRALNTVNRTPRRSAAPSTGPGLLRLEGGTWKRRRRLLIEPRSRLASRGEKRASLKRTNDERGSVFQSHELRSQPIELEGCWKFVCRSCALGRTVPSVSAVQAQDKGIVKARICRTAATLATNPGANTPVGSRTCICCETEA